MVQMCLVYSRIGTDVLGIFKDWYACIGTFKVWYKWAGTFGTAEHDLKKNKFKHSSTHLSSRLMKIFIPGNSYITVISIPVLCTVVQSSLYTVEVYSRQADVRRGFVSYKIKT